MSTTQVTTLLQTVISELITELEKLVDTSGKVKNNDIVGCVQNVVLMDYQMKVDDLPKNLQELYYKSRINPMVLHNFVILKQSLSHMARTGK